MPTIAASLLFIDACALFRTARLRFHGFVCIFYKDIISSMTRRNILRLRYRVILHTHASLRRAAPARYFAIIFTRLHLFIVEERCYVIAAYFHFRYYFMHRECCRHIYAARGRALISSLRDDKYSLLRVYKHAKRDGAYEGMYGCRLYTPG